jgi:L-ascorbate metabolism protein UlaG (beta-lactamase superfamily)
MITIKWLAHASFLIRGDGLRIITDPYNPDVLDLPPVTEPADVVIRSSDDDDGHCFVDTIPPGFDLITATEIVDTGASVRGLAVSAVWAQESLVHKDAPSDNAMYRFELGGIQVSHMGDVGNPLTDRQMAALAGTDVLLALAGGPPTIELDDLCAVIESVKPRVVIPMHYRIPGVGFFMLPVTELASRFAAGSVTHVGSAEIELSRDSLPDDTRLYVMQPSLAGAPA